jgi:hypothetical protein
LQDELLAIDDDGMTGIMTPGVTRYDGETLREHINNLAFALVAPLRAYDNRSPASAQFQLRGFSLRHLAARASRTHFCPRRLLRKGNY